MSNDDVVRRIAAEVIRRLESESGDVPAGSESSPRGGYRIREGKSALILLTGGDRQIDEALSQLERISEKSSQVTVVMSPSAQSIVGAPAVRRAAPSAQVLTEGSPDSLLAGVEAVYLPNMSLNAASKIAALQGDSLVCILAIGALLRGLPVVASTGSLLPGDLDEGRVPSGLESRLARLLDELRSLGVQLSDAPFTMPSTLRATHESNFSGSALENGSCDQSTTGDCAACGLCIERTPQAVGALVSSGADRIGAAIGAKPVTSELGGLIDHTLLKPDATEKDIRKLCDEARQHEFASVCVNPGWVGLAAELLKGTRVKVCTVVGFPLGATTPTAKAIETRDAIANGATEIDMVINVGALKSGNDELVRRDIEAVVDAARGKAIVKVILETALLTREEKVKACLLCKMAGADFVKTSTGFSTGGATTEDIALMRETVGPGMGVKASGGIRDRDTAEAMVAAGATRIGASASVAIATGTKSSSKGY